MRKYYNNVLVFLKSMISYSQILQFSLEGEHIVRSIYNEIGLKQQFIFSTTYSINYVMDFIWATIHCVWKADYHSYTVTYLKASTIIK